ncbi:MAG: DUF1176 domain-containing protein [Cardiobacteriaceae bacterium]|nr:DUF1176 domain-containing protein [Cardiobacteriaceae bacterium]
MFSLLTALFISIQSALLLPTSGETEPVLAEVEMSVDSDWELVCDNAKTCRAVGYHSDASLYENPETHYPTSVLIKREMGKDEVVVKVNLDTFELPTEVTILHPLEEAEFEMFIGDKSYGKLAWSKLPILLNDEQSKALLDNVHHGLPVEFRWQGKIWALSSEGMLETLQEMDREQGYQHTQSALVEKGSQKAPTETYTYPQINPPKWLDAEPQFIDRDSEQGQKLQALLRHSTNESGMTLEDAHLSIWRNLAPNESGMTLEDCAVFQTDEEASYLPDEAKRFEVSRIDEHHTVVLGLCSLGAYQSDSVAWVVNQDFTEVKQVISDNIQAIEDESLTGAFKARGIGDCWSMFNYHWDGNAFVNTYTASTGMCKGFMGGAWTLPITLFRLHDNPLPDFD